jgi:hypothetical protein
MTATSRHHRWASALAIALLATGAAIGSAGPAAAEAPQNVTPESATAFGSLPYQDGIFWEDAPVATDPAAQLVAATCNSGAEIYGAAWWKYTAPNETTFVVHAGNRVGNVYEPIGLAVVAGNLDSVHTCGEESSFSSVTDTGAITLGGGESVYFVTYATSLTTLVHRIGVYPSSGVVPSNDAIASPTQIESLPFSVTQDTTLATRETEPSCYNKFGHGPSVWYSLTATRSELLNIDISSDYSSQFVIVSGVGTPSESRLCGEPQLQVEEGVTYLIGVSGEDQLRNSGRLTVNLSVPAPPPPPPTVRLTIAPKGTVKKKTGVVSLTGDLTCTGASTTNPVNGSLKQTYKRDIHQQGFTGTAATCTGQTAAWTAVVVPSTFMFTGGDAKVTASVVACNSGGCASTEAEGTVKLKLG